MADKTKYFAGGFLFNSKKKEVFLHRRDSNTNINPNMIAFFGGTSEDEDQGDPKRTFLRELEEEINLRFGEDRVVELCDYFNPDFDIHRYVFYIEDDTPTSEMRLGEGAGFEWIPLKDVASMNISKRTLQDINYFINRLANSS